MSSSDVDGNYDVGIDVYQLNDSSLALQTYKQLIEEKYTYMKTVNRSFYWKNMKL